MLSTIDNLLKLENNLFNNKITYELRPWIYETCQKIHKPSCLRAILLWNKLSHNSFEQAIYDGLSCILLAVKSTEFVGELSFEGYDQEKLYVSELDVFQRLNYDTYVPDPNEYLKLFKPNKMIKSTIKQYYLSEVPYKLSAVISAVCYSLADDFVNIFNIDERILEVISNHIAKTLNSFDFDKCIEQNLDYQPAIIVRKSVNNIMKIKQGIYGEIYKVDNYAIKKFKNVANDQGLIEFYLRELIFLNYLDHPNIVKFEFVVSKKYLAMELMDCDLHDYIVSNKPDIKFQKYCIRELLTGLVYIHEMGVIVRDIKPKNILLKDNHVKYCDFGMACGFRSLDKFDHLYSIVTAPYRAPELVFDHDFYDSKIDIWSLMCVIYELHFGEVLITDYLKFGKILVIPQDMKVPRIFRNVRFEGFKKVFDQDIGRIFVKGLVIDPKLRLTAKELLEIF